MNFFDTSALESALRRILLDGGVAEVVYANRPKSVPERAYRFAVVSVSGNLDDMACYGDCVVRITLYARDAAGLKDSRALSEMQKLLGKKKFDELLGGLIEKPQGKPVLVPLSDKRQPMNTAQNDFKD